MWLYSNSENALQAKASQMVNPCSRGFGGDLKILDPMAGRLYDDFGFVPVSAREENLVFRNGRHGQRWLSVLLETHSARKLCCNGFFSRPLKVLRSCRHCVLYKS